MMKSVVASLALLGLAVLIGCGSSNATGPAQSPRQAALERTIKCLKSIPLVRVDTSVGPLADFEVFADVDRGGGNAQVAVFSSHAQAVKYANSGVGSGVVGDLAAAIYTYKGSPAFQAAVEGCLA